MLSLLKRVFPVRTPTQAGARFLYLHVPKTAGSAVKAAIGRSAQAGLFVTKPHATGFADLSRAERALETFITIREPVSWYLSLYNFKMHSESDKGYADMERNRLEDFVDDVVYGRNGVDGFMRWNRPAERKPHVRRMVQAYLGAGAQARLGFATLNLLFYSAANWKRVLAAPDPHALLAQSLSGPEGVRHVLRQETLGADFERMTGGSVSDIDLKTRVNAMDSNPYTALIDPAAVAHIQAADRFIFSRYYPTPST
jgi:hypothetical protein